MGPYFGPVSKFGTRLLTNQSGPVSLLINITFFALLANIPRRSSCCQSVDSSEKYELTDSETEYHLGSETELAVIDNDIDKVIRDIQDLKNLIDCVDLTDEVYLPDVMGQTMGLRR